jgi:hypothetical protein
VDSATKFGSLFGGFTEKNSEIHTMELAIAPLNPYSYYFHSMKIAISMKIGIPYYFQPRSILYFHSKDFQRIIET